MCDCIVGPPAPPDANGAVRSPVVGCPAAQSEILVLDEIGLPIANTAVTLMINGASRTETTDAEGKVCLSVPPGTAATVTLNEMHEGGAGQPVSTPSGTHFSLNGTGP